MTIASPRDDSRTAMRVPGPAEVLAAAARLAGHVRRTPLLRSRALDTRLGARVLLKPECLQHTGSFKLRGATNRLLQLHPRCPGVTAYSSGNHGRGVAAAAREIGRPALIFMPRHAPAVKIDAIRSLGAEVALFEYGVESGPALARACAAERGWTFVHPFDDPEVLAGNGTVGLEMAEDARAAGLTLDALVICCGGGGLTAGCALALEHASPTTELYTAEPSTYDDHARSRVAGERVTLPRIRETVCDALLNACPGELTWEVNRTRIAAGAAVSDDEALAAMRFAALELKLVVEPSGAVALAAVLQGRVPVRDRTIGVVLSGGNVDPALLARTLS